MTGSLHWITHCYHLQVALQTRTHPGYTHRLHKLTYGTAALSFGLRDSAIALL